MMNMKWLPIMILGLVVMGCTEAPKPGDAQASTIKRQEAPYRTDRLPSAEPKTDDYPPVEGNPAGVGTPPFHDNFRSGA